MPKVSIIIPVFGAAATITGCIDSVLAQSLDDIEVILVDDHGHDDSIEKARKHIEGYQGGKRFVFTETLTNSGPGSARNKGIETASGEYLSFLDSDDTLEPGYCLALYEAATTVHADIACCDAWKHSGSGRNLLSNPAFESGKLSGTARKKILRNMVTYLWTYMFRREFLEDNDIRFPASRSAEDSCFVCCCWLMAANAAKVGSPLYNYVEAPQSLSRKKDTLRWQNRLDSFRSLEHYTKEHGIYRKYRGIVGLLVFKKGWLLAVKDYLTNNLF